MRYHLVAALAALLAGWFAPAGASELTSLTGPQGVAAPAPSGLTGYPRPNRWDVWQYYAVDRSGYFRPRVAFAPQPHYLFNGAPYPLLPVRPREFMPHVFD